VALNLPYVSSEISSIEQSENIDPNRVFVTGFSAGATMSFHIGCALSKQVDAIAPVSGAMYRTGEPCALSHPVSELLIVGTNDIIPFAGSAILSPIPQVVQTWTTQDGCGSHSSTTTTGAVTEQTFSACNEHTAVALYTIQGGVHTWPGPGAPGPDAQLSAAQAVWAFFSQHPGESATHVSVSLSSLRYLASGRVVATLATGEPVRGNATIKIGGAVAARRSVSLPRGARVRLSLKVPRGRHGHGSLRLALSDSYGRHTTISGTIDLR
jgi:polyhydroxybutyrate depolymerase